MEPQTMTTMAGSETEFSAQDCFLRVADRLVCLVLLRHKMLPLTAMAQMAAAC